MNRQQKKSFVDGLSNQFAQAQAAFVVKYQGLTVSQMQTLRFSLQTDGAVLQVAKNRLSKLALVNMAGAQELNSYFTGQLAVVFASDNVTGVAKSLATFAKKNEKLEIIAGCYEAQLFTSKQVKALAMIPSREVLLAQLCGILNAPITKLANVLDQVAKKDAQPALEVAPEQV